MKCGAVLEGSRSARALDSVDEWGENIGKRAEEWGKDFPKRLEKECFGLPHGGTIVGLIIGIIIILVGVTSLAGIKLEIWPLLIIIFGLLIFGGAIYTLTRKR
ncbi:zinc ribbon domain-containing protein [Candidatus Bathyarchaeota archaeon]|nr:zinc ribbon domain-containing protein [Candidatus Bathyarchaeota archaeon]